MKIILRLLFPLLIIELLICAALLERLDGGASFAEFTRTRPITGNSAERLTVTLAHGGWNGPPGCRNLECNQADEMTLCTPTGNATLYLGSESNVNASNGYPLEAGACQHYKAGSRPIDTDQFWTFASSNSNIAITLR